MKKIFTFLSITSNHYERVWKKPKYFRSSDYVLTNIGYCHLSVKHNYLNRHEQVSFKVKLYLCNDALPGIKRNKIDATPVLQCHFCLSVCIRWDNGDLGFFNTNPEMNSYHGFFNTNPPWLLRCWWPWISLYKFSKIAEIRVTMHGFL